MCLSVSVTARPSLCARPVIPRRHCDHSQCLFSRSSPAVVSSTRSSPSLARRLVEASGLARSFVRVPYIRTRTSPSHSRASRSLALLSRLRFPLSRQRSLSHRALSRLVARPSHSTCHSSRLSRLSSLVSSPSRVSPPSVASPAVKPASLSPRLARGFSSRGYQTNVRMHKRAACLFARQARQGSFVDLLLFICLRVQFRKFAFGVNQNLEVTEEHDTYLFQWHY